jgi:hypothetical protein
MNNLTIAVIAIAVAQALTITSHLVARKRNQEAAGTRH